MKIQHLLSDLQEAKLLSYNGDGPMIGFESRANAKKVKDALIKFGFESTDGFEEMLKAKDVNAFSSDRSMGITYFYFKSDAAKKRAVKLANEIIDRAEESEWN